MKRLIRIDAEITDDKRWIYHNDRKNHQISETSLQETITEAGYHDWSRNQVFGKKLGKKLFDLLNGSGGLLRNFQRDHHNSGDHATLGLQLPDELMDLPFEIMWDGSAFFTQVSGLPIVRQVTQKNRFRKRELENRPISLLFMACSPTDTHAVLSFEAEEDSIAKVIEKDKLPVDFHVEDSGSLDGLKFTMKDLQPIDVLQLSGHAGIGEDGPFFQMESEIGRMEKVGPKALWSAMRFRPPSLLFLSGCKTGKMGIQGVASFAQAMVQQGISYVLGWGLSVSDLGATRFECALYRGLGEGLPLDAAVNEARREIEADYKTWSMLRVFSDGTPLEAITDPSERVVRRSKRSEQYRRLKGSQVKVLEYGFVGRRRQVQRGIQVLKGDVPDKNGLLVTGTAGIGKSTLTGKLVERFPDREMVVISGEVSQAEVLNQLELLFDKKGHKEGLEKLKGLDPFEDKVKAALRGALAEIPTLIILDDFEKNLEQNGDQFWLKGDTDQVLLPMLQALPWANGKTQVIITSRFPFVLEAKGKEWVGSSLERIPLAALRGADLDKKKRNLQNIAGSPHHELFLKFSGGNPRLMEWFETLAIHESALDSAKLEKDLEEKSEEFIQRYLARVLIDNQDQEFRAFLSKAAVYRTPEKAGAFAPLGSAALLEKAVNLTLMEMEGAEEPVYWVMPLIREELWSKVKNADEVHRQAYDWYDGKVKGTAKFVFDDLDACVHHGEHGHKMEGCWAHASKLANYFHHSVLASEGVRRLERLIDVFPEKEKASYDSDEVSFLGNLSLLMLATNQFSMAETLMRLTIQINEASYGPDHPKVATHLNNLAQLLHDTDRLDEAEELIRRTLKIYKAWHGSDHPKLAKSLSNLASLLQDTNRLDEAESLVRRALEIDEASYGAEHPNVATNLNNLASLLLESGHLDEAERLMRRALKIDEAFYGSDHPEVATDLNNLAMLFLETDRFDEAEPLIRRALEIDEAFFGADHPKVASNLNNLGQLLHDTNQLVEAEPLMHRALEIDRASFGANHPKVAIRLNNLAQLFHDTNRLDEAEPLIRRALEIDEASLGSDHPNVATCLNNLGQLLRHTKRLNEAMRLTSRALEINKVSFGERHPSTMISAMNLLNICLELGNADEVMKSFETLAWLLSAKEEDLQSCDLRIIQSRLQCFVEDWNT